MLVIPVIDVRGGQAVAAIRGDRASYRPLRTPLVADADPVAVAKALRTLFPFPTLYVADLDGIEGRGADFAVQHRLAEAWPGSELWIDDGSAEGQNGIVGLPPSPLRRGLGWGDTRQSQLSVSYVTGSESLASLEAYEHARNSAGPAAPLSLDFRGDTFLGPPQLLDDADLWPRRVIVMTLARVGSAEGPDLARLAGIVARARGRQVFAAGGVRNADDLKALRDIGAAGALIATALHNRTITPADLEALGAESDS